MRITVLATATLLSLGSGTALADRAQVKLQEQASLLPNQAPRPAASVGRERALRVERRLAASGGNHPQSETDRHGTQYAASGLSWIRRT